MQINTEENATGCSSPRCKDCQIRHSIPS